MEILTGEQMRRVDRHVIETLGIPSLLLMESAGRAIAGTLIEHYPDAAERGVVLLCGKGHNGGDGLAAARHLARAGVRPNVVLLARARELHGDVLFQHQAAIGSGVEVEEVVDAAMWARLAPQLAQHGLVVDALLGTGAHGGARGLLAQVVEDINACGATIVSVDLPSGVDADATHVTGPAVQADRTYTLCRPKLPLVTGPSARLAGTWTVLPIGIPDEAVASVQPDMEWLDREALRGLFAPRAADSHKGTYGHLLLVAGSKDKSGAAVLAARAALRCGVGLVTVATSSSAQSSVAIQQAEVMTAGLSETPSGNLAKQAAPALVKMLELRSALAIGPGLGNEPETFSVVLTVAVHRSRPTVVDADGLNALAAAGPTALARLREGEVPLVLTPHPGEAARMLGENVSSVQADRMEAARRLAGQTGAVVVLKGHRTVIAGPDRALSVSSSGNPGMATAGTGDALTGVLGALLARGFDARTAARAAVFVHGDAGDRAAKLRGPEGMIASDLIEQLPAALAGLDAPERAASW